MNRPSPAPSTAALESASLIPALPASENTPIREFLAFKLGDEEYGMNILCVQEIRSFEKPTALANAPADILGVVNLRGVIVPIIDLRVRLKLAKATYDAQTVVIVVNAGPHVVGLVVDGVSDVLTLKPEQMRPVPSLDSGFSTEHLLALGSVDERMLILLDIEKYLGTVLGGATGIRTH
jgi:purine-binding chemotaxis protein CheW